MSSNPAIPEALAGALRDCQSMCVLTGSGISAESGVPTFRDAQEGLWAEYDPQELATPEAFLRDPELVWNWYRWRRRRVAEAKPNPAHLALTEFAARIPAFSLITQNVDGLHQRAGSSNVIEFHGNLFQTRCFAESCSLNVDNVDDDTSNLPRCPSCGSLARPGVVWFGEAIPPSALESAMIAASNCDMFLSIGTSSVVWPAAGLIDVAMRHGAVTVEINPNPTMESCRVAFQLAGKAGQLLPALVSLNAKGF